MRSPIKIILLVSIFILPMLVSLGLYYYPHLLPAKKTNHGIFIQPLVSRQAIDLPQNALHQWQIIYFPFNCSAPTVIQTMQQLHQMYIALNQDQKRVALVRWQTKPCHASPFHFQSITLTAIQYQKLKAHLQIQHPQINFSVVNKIYLMDPLGNLFMYYNATASPLDILKDMKTILRSSQIG